MFLLDVSLLPGSGRMAGSSGTSDRAESVSIAVVGVVNPWDWLNDRGIGVVCSLVR